jgi:hypothetical protein
MQGPPSVGPLPAGFGYAIALEELPLRFRAPSFRAPRFDRVRFHRVRFRTAEFRPVTPALAYHWPAWRLLCVT